MAAENRETAIGITIDRYEGSAYTNDPHDPGGPTRWGITLADARLHWKRDATADDVRTMPRAIAVNIYRQKYWARMNCDADPAGVDFVTFDYGVHSGVGRAMPCRERNRQPLAVDWVKAICAERLAFLKRLKIWKFYAKGFTNRVVDVEARGVKMALQANSLQPKAVEKKLQDHADEASKQAKKDITKAGGTVAAPTSTQVPDSPVQFDFNSIPHWVLIGIGIVLAGVAVYFAYRWWINRKRAAAYAAVAKE